MSRCHLSHELPWASLESAYLLPRELQRLHLSHPTPPRSWTYEQQRRGVPPPPSYVAAISAYNASTLATRKAAEHFARRFCATMEAFSVSERRKHSDEDVMAVREVLTESDRQAHPTFFDVPHLFDRWRELGDWCEDEQSAEVEPLQRQEMDQEEEEEDEVEGGEGARPDAVHANVLQPPAGAEAPPRPRTPPVLRQHPAVQGYWTEHATCDADALKWLLFNDRLLPLLALIRRCPSRFNHYPHDLLTNKHRGAQLEYYFPRLLLFFYVHLNLAIALGETAGHGAVCPKPSTRSPPSTSPYHAELTGWLCWSTPESCDAGHDPVLNEWVRPFLRRRVHRRDEWLKWGGGGLREWDLDVGRCEELCRAVWRVLVHMDVLVRAVEERRHELERDERGGGGGEEVEADGKPPVEGLDWRLLLTDVEGLRDAFFEAELPQFAAAHE